MMHISIQVYKDTGKFYTNCEVTHPEDIPLWSDRFRKFIRDHLPAQYSGGFVVVNDMPDEKGFHCALYRIDDLISEGSSSNADAANSTGTTSSKLSDTRAASAVPLPLSQTKTTTLAGHGTCATSSIFENTLKMRIPTYEEWDLLIDAIGDDNTITHWENMCFWVQKKDFEESNTIYRANCGYLSARNCNFISASYRIVYVGFRPAFDALSCDRLCVRDGETIAIGTLYMNGRPIKVPLNPVWDGDIESYIPGASLSFGPALDDPAYTVTAIKIGNTFIADRTLLKNISYKDIENNTSTDIEALDDAICGLKEIFDAAFALNAAAQGTDLSRLCTDRLVGIRQNIQAVRDRLKTHNN